MPDYVFVSYDRADRSYVNSLVHRLTAEAIPYWTDPDSDRTPETPPTEPAADPTDAAPTGSAADPTDAAPTGSADDPTAAETATGLIDNVAGAAAVLVVVTPAAMASPRVAADLRRARELGRPILPLLRRRVRSRPDLGDQPAEDVTGGGMPSPAFFDQLRAHTGPASSSVGPASEKTGPASQGPPVGAAADWRPRTRLPHRLGPLPRTPAEVAAVRALLAAAVILAVCAVLDGDGDRFLIFPAFGIPDILFGWFRQRRFRAAGRWAVDLRMSILLAGLSIYLAVVAPFKFARPGHPSLLIGAMVAAGLGATSAAVWLIRVVRDRPPRTA